jgi:hypothetical protein
MFVAVLSSGAHAAAANVDFVKPEGFSDVRRPHVLVDRKANLESLRNHLVRQAGLTRDGFQAQQARRQGTSLP